MGRHGAKFYGRMFNNGRIWLDDDVYNNDKHKYKDYQFQQRR